MQGIKVVLRQDFVDEWEHMLVYQNGTLLSDGLESHLLSAEEILMELAELGIISLEKEEIKEDCE